MCVCVRVVKDVDRLQNTDRSVFTQVSHSARPIAISTDPRPFGPGCVALTRAPVKRNVWPFSPLQMGPTLTGKKGRKEIEKRLLSGKRLIVVRLGAWHHFFCCRALRYSLYSALSHDRVLCRSLGRSISCACVCR